jgi:hypothetical protein
MESSTPCKDANARTCSNPSISKPTKAINAREELEMKRKGLVGLST